MERWVCALTGVASTGVVTQLYPPSCSVGVNPATATNGQLIRQPCEGTMYSMQIKTDGVNAGSLELYDISGIEYGEDVSSSNVISNAVLVAALAAGTAKLIYDQNYIASPTTPISISHSAFQKGLAARNVASGAISLNLSVSGGYRKTTKVG